MKAVFLDRDGTVIVEPPNERLTNIKDIQFFPDTESALKRLQDSGFALIMITNQAGVGEGLITLEKFHDMETNGVEKQLAESDITFTKVYVCPHAAGDSCDCRKPQPKMLLDAAKELDIDLAISYMIGDNLSDIGAGINAGAKTILVKTGIHDVSAPDATFTAENLAEAADYVINH